MSGQTYRDLIVWQRAVQLSVASTSSPPASRPMSVSDSRRSYDGRECPQQATLQRANGRNSTGEYKHFLGMARGANMEIQTQLVIAGELGIGDQEEAQFVEGLSHEVGKMLVAMMNKL